MAQAGPPPPPGPAKPEDQHLVTVSVAYSYDQNSVNHKGTFTKPLEKITFITPGVI